MLFYSVPRRDCEKLLLACLAVIERGEEVGYTGTDLFKDHIIGPESNISPRCPVFELSVGQ